MIQGRQNFRFAVEPREPFRISRKRGGKHLNGDIAIKFGVASLVHFSHPPSTDRCEDFVRPESFADRKRHIDESAQFSGLRSGLCLDDRHSEKGIRRVRGGFLLRTALPIHERFALREFFPRDGAIGEPLGSARRIV
jgi:hypothetical protein